MNIFIFDSVNQLTGNYHSDGGLVIIASDIEHAKMIVSSNPYIDLTDEEWASGESYPLEGNHTPKYWVFPDAGCC